MRDRAAMDAHHASPMMKTLASLREKYDLHMKVERFVSVEENEEDQKYITPNWWTESRGSPGTERH